MIVRKLFILLVFIGIASVMSSCGIIGALMEGTRSVAGLTQTGTVITRSVYIRSSYAVVAADLLEVKRGETVEILDEKRTDETAFDKILWYRVRAFDELSTEGWIEAQHIIKGDALDGSKQLAKESSGLQAQATGKLRAISNLRLTPEQKDDNILLRLENGSTFEIIDWEYVTKTEKDPEPDNEEIKAAKDDNEPEKIDQKYDLWYKVRLDPSVSPAPMGWIFGRQINLQVPTDIIYYQTNKRKFVTWLSLDGSGISGQKVTSSNSDVVVTKPGSWVILSRTNEVKAIDGVEPDFDGILVLGYDKYGEEHYTAYSTTRQRLEIWGMLPLKLEGTGDNKIFTVKLRNQDTGELVDQMFVLFKDKNRHLRVSPPEILSKKKGRSNRK